MYYKIINNNKENWILLIHSICSDMRVFDKYIDSLSNLYNILLLDLPGHGISRDIPMNYDIQNEVVEIMNKNNIPKVDIWAVSLGAIISIKIMEKYPERVSSAVLAGAAFGLNNRLYSTLFYMFNIVGSYIPSGIWLKLFTDVVISGKNKKRIVNQMKEYAKDINTQTILQWLKFMEHEYKRNICNVANSIPIKKVYIIGSKDNVFKPCIVKHIAQNDFNQIVVLENCSHLCHLDINVDIAKMLG